MVHVAPLASPFANRLVCRRSVHDIGDGGMAFEAWRFGGRRCPLEGLAPSQDGREEEDPGERLHRAWGLVPVGTGEARTIPQSKGFDGCENIVDLGGLNIQARVGPRLEL